MGKALKESLESVMEQQHQLLGGAETQQNELGNTQLTCPSHVVQLNASVQQVQGQVEQLLGEHSDLARTLHTIREEQLQLQAAQKEQECYLREVASQSRLETASNGGALGADYAVVQDLRAEVMVISNAITVLCGRVEQLSMQESQNALKSEVGTIAHVVGQLCDRVDKMEPSKHTSSSPNITLQSTTFDESQQQHPSIASPDNVKSSPCKERAGYTPARSTIASPTKKAPSPSMWLTEPLSVSVARSEQTGMQHSSCAQATGRLMQRYD